MPMLLFIILVFTAPFAALALILIIQMLPQPKPPSESEMLRAQEKARRDLDDWLNRNR